MAEQTEGEQPQFKTPMPQTPTTKILAVGTFASGTNMLQVQRILPTEIRETLRWQDRPVVFIGRPAGCRLYPEYDRRSGSAHAMLEELPLGKAHLMTFRLTAIDPLNPLRQLPLPAVSK